MYLSRNGQKHMDSIPLKLSRGLQIGKKGLE